MNAPSSPSLPALEGQDLLRNNVRIPTELPAGFAIVLIAFSPTHQSEAMSWVGALEEISTSGKATVRQIILLPAFAKMGERIVLDQLIKTVPSEAHGATVVVFGDPGAVAKSLGANTNHIVLAALDPAHAVVWTASGAHTPAVEASMRATLV